MISDGDDAGCLHLLSLLLLGEEDGVDVGEDAALGDGRLVQELVKLLVVADGELDVARDDARALVVLGGVPGELEELRGQVLEDGGHVDGAPPPTRLAKPPWRMKR